MVDCNRGGSGGAESVRQRETERETVTESGTLLNNSINADCGGEYALLFLI
jgi:hypothetical protein